MNDEIIIKADDGNFLCFWWDTAKNEHSSTLANRPIYDEVLRLRVNVPGDNKTETTFELERKFTEVTDANGKVLKGSSVRVNDHISRQYSREIEKFKSTGQSVDDMGGTPIEQWTLIDRRMAAELKAMHIHTVEALASLGDAGINALGMGGRGLVEKAKAFLEAADGGAPLSRLADENEALKGKVSEQAITIAQLADRLKALEDNNEEPRRKPGRPPKVKELA